MLSNEDHAFIFEYSYIPEHLTAYVCSISGAEPFIHEGYLYYLKENHMIFVGYPLNKSFSQQEANEILRELIYKHKINSVALIGEAKLEIEGKIITESSDHYYLLDLSSLEIDAKLRNSIRRANRDLKIEIYNNITSEHRAIIDEYIKSERFDSYTVYIFERLPKYIADTKDAIVINARTKEGFLAGFNVLDLGSKNYAFYMFNFISRNQYVPGVSDLLMNKMIEIAVTEKRDYINLGLGINEGVIFFKKKWGGRVFLDYKFEYKILSERKTSPMRRFLSLIRRYF